MVFGELKTFVSKTIESAPGVVLALINAARSDPTPALLVFATVKAAGTARSSRGCSMRRRECVPRRRRLRGNHVVFIGRTPVRVKVGIRSLIPRHRIGANVTRQHEELQN